MEILNSSFIIFIQKSYELRAKGNETILLQNFNQHCEMEVFAIHAGNLYDEDKITEEKNVPILFC